LLIICFSWDTGICKEARKDVKEITKMPSIKKLEYKKAECGGLEFDKTTGGMKRKPNVDLIVSKIEIIRNERGVWVKPWIKNRCRGSISREIHVSVKDVVVTFGSIPPQTSVTLGYSVGVPAAASYTVTVDYDHRISEADEGNNSCTKSSTGNCP
jgi:hypothetical protein